MANLIITIISIALVAVAALLGAYYGGQAFTNYQEKAQGLALQNTMQQISAAIKLWEVDHGQTMTTAGVTTIGTIASQLVPTYLQSFLDANGNLVPNPHGGSNTTVRDTNDLSNGNIPKTTKYLAITYQSNDPGATDVDVQNFVRACKGAARVGHGTAVPTDQTQVGLSGPFDCMGTGNIDNCLAGAAANANNYAGYCVFRIYYRLD